MRLAFRTAVVAAALALAPCAAHAQRTQGNSRMVHQRPAGAPVWGFGVALHPERLPSGGFTIGYPVVKEVTVGSAAARSGMVVGDMIMAVNGRDARRGPIFPDQTPGTRYVLRVRRGSEERELTYLFPAPPAARS